MVTRGPLDSCPAVVEVFQSWCGPCKAVQSTFKKLYFDLNDRPLKFYSVSGSWRRGSGGGHDLREGGGWAPDPCASPCNRTADTSWVYDNGQGLYWGPQGRQRRLTPDVADALLRAPCVPHADPCLPHLPGVVGTAVVPEGVCGQVQAHFPFLQGL